MVDWWSIGEKLEVRGWSNGGMEWWRDGVVEIY